MIRWGYVATKLLQVQTSFTFHCWLCSKFPANRIGSFVFLIPTVPTPQVLGSLFYAYYVFVRLCIPQFRSISLQLFDLKAMVLSVFNSILPGKPAPDLWTLAWTTIVAVTISFLILLLPSLQECWFSSWDSLPYSTVGSTHLRRCFVLLIGCFTRCWFLLLQNFDWYLILYIFNSVALNIWLNLIES